MITLTDTPFRPSDALEAFQADAKGAGAIVSFTGLVREHAASGDVQTLYLQAYCPLTERGIRGAVGEAFTRWSLVSARVIHRTGTMGPAEPIVFVATAAPHRRAAFEAADFLMDYLKTEAVFWKQETTPGGARWIEPRPEDYRDKARWADQTGDTS